MVDQLFRRRHAFPRLVHSSRFFGRPLLVLGCVASLFLTSISRAQIVDDFNDGNDEGWTRFDPLGGLGIAAPATFDFPDGGYRLVAPVPAVPDGGSARAVAYRDDVMLEDFYTAVDIVDWDHEKDLGVGMGLRLTEVGLGQTDGYVLMFYANPSGSNPYGEFEITQIVDEAGAASLVLENVKLEPGQSYRMVAMSEGSAIRAFLYDLNDLTAPLSEIMIDDSSAHPMGHFGLVTFYRGGEPTAPTSSAEATYDNFVLQESRSPVDLPGTERGVVGAPQVLERLPATRARFHDAGQGIQFKASTLNGAEIEPTGIRLTLNGRDVTSSLEVGGTGAERTVLYRGLNPGQIYRAEIELTAVNGLTGRNTFEFDTLEQEAILDAPYLVIEAEDFNFGDENCDIFGPFIPFDGGRFIENPEPTNVDLNDNVLPFGRVGYAKRVGLPEADYSDFSTVDDIGTDDSYYRSCDSPGIRFLQNTVRTAYSAADLQEQVLYRTEAGEWLNYTRVFNGLESNVYLRVASRWAQTIRVDRILGDASGFDQSFEEVGIFHVPNTVTAHHFGHVPLTDRQGNTLALDWVGENTLRLTIEGEAQAFEQKNTLFMDYLLMAPAADERVTPLPFKMEEVQSQEGRFSFVFPTQEGVTYLPEYKNSLAEGEGEWKPLPRIEGDGSQAVIEELAEGVSRFYRVRAQ